MTTRERLGLALVALLTAFLGGLWTGKGQVRTVVQYKDKIVEKEVKGDTEIQWKDRIVIVTHTIYKDGTVQDTTTTKSDNKTEQKHEDLVEKDDTKESIKVTTPDADNYEVGIAYKALLPGYVPGLDTTSEARTSVTVGRRLFGDVWVTGEVAPITKEVSIGLSVHF